MKKMIFIVGITTLMLTGCNQSKSSAQVLKDETQRHEIMQAIANDKEMMTEMSDIMMKSENAKMMMMENQDMMSMMMGNRGMMKNNPGMMQGMMGNMMQMAQTDSVMRKNMTGMMASHRPMMQSMMQTMKEKGIMSPECMKANMQNLDKMKMDKEGMMDKNKKQ
jgi:hypothetical protein